MYDVLEGSPGTNDWKSLFGDLAESVGSASNLFKEIKGFGKTPDVFAPIAVAPVQSVPVQSYNANLGWKDFLFKPNSTLTIIAVSALGLAGILWLVDKIRGK